MEVQHTTSIVTAIAAEGRLPGLDNAAVLDYSNSCQQPASQGQISLCSNMQRLSMPDAWQRVAATATYTPVALIQTMVHSLRGTPVGAEVLEAPPFALIVSPEH